MSKETIIYIIEIILIIFLLIKFIPKDQIQKAHLAYLFKLIITWSVGLIVAELRLIEYPVRLFPYATKASFLFEFFFYPSICALFVVNYPERKSTIKQLMYYIYFCTTLTIVEVIQERYTDVLHYIHWSWYISWITFFLTFLAAHKYSLWFFRRLKETTIK